jgi:thioredoxin 1
MSETTFTDGNFNELTSKGTALVDFWAPWCGPCRIQGPILEKVASQFAGKAAVGKLNVDENATVPRKFGVSGIPTLILFKDGVEAQRFVGLQTEQTLVNALNAQL